MDAQQRRRLIERYKQGASAVRDAVAGATDAQLDARPGPGEWTAREIVQLERMTDDDWERAGTHTESGPHSCETWLEIYAAHAHDHAEQIRRSRRAATT